MQTILVVSILALFILSSYLQSLEVKLWRLLSLNASFLKNEMSEVKLDILKTEVTSGTHVCGESHGNRTRGEQISRLRRVVRSIDEGNCRSKVMVENAQ